MKTVKQAAILIGGKGTRLGDAVKDTPKPLLDVCGRPFVEHLMLNLRRHGFDDFILLAGYQAGVVKDKYGAGAAFLSELDASITVIVEPSPLGTAGALKYAKNSLQDEFLLLNGDSIFDFNYLDLALAVDDSNTSEYLGRVALLPVENATRYGFVELDGDTVTAFREKPTQPESGTINSGVYWLKSKVLSYIPDTPCSLEQDVFPTLVDQGRLSGRSYQGFFIDIGIPEDLQRARDSLSTELQKPAAFLDRDGTLNHDEGYTHKIEGFRWIDDAQAAIKALNDAGFLVFLVTNQAGIARGFYDAAAVDTLHDWMRGELASLGAHIDDIRFCPHHPQGSVAELSISCDCRKPGTAMLTSLVEDWHPDLSHSFMLGDSDKDAQAGIAIGIRGKKIDPACLLAEVTQMISYDEKA
ncbi:MAG: D,D-heptose 1,7-bisphosphate phosphatase [Halioglobus sp.]|jgi:D,D-heptose 1,7-bisphosphate phosphatase